MMNEYQVSDEEIESFIEKIWNNFIDDTQSLIEIDSSLDPDHADDGCPFGPGPRKALDQTLRIAERLGFSVHDGDGYAGYAHLSGESEQQLGIIGHVDVVPAGEGWHYEPFTLTQKEGVLLGRGTTDDKIPLLSALYAVKFWMERKVSLRHDIRFIFGCNEETGMADVPYYLAHHKAPDFLFTPDADFPLCYGEKGLFGVTLTYELSPDALDNQAVVSFEGGSATNAVPAYARAVVKVDSANLPESDHITVVPCEEGSLVSAEGISGHASRPEGTSNAVGILTNYLAGLKACNTAEQAWFSFVASALAGRTDGSALGIAAEDPDFGHLTSVLGTMHKVGNAYRATIDIRFPQAITGKELEAAFVKLADHIGAKVEITRNQEPFIVDPDMQPVQALVRAYCESTGRPAKPFTMGGATYAREFPRAVSFGPADPEALSVPDWVGEMHGADEGVTVEAVKHALRIYVRAFGNLAQIDLR